MRPTPRTASTFSSTPVTSRLRGLVAGTAVAALALGLAPGATAQVASSEAADTPERAQVAVRLKVATEPVVRVAVPRRTWPSRLVQAQGVPVDGNDLVEVVRDGREVRGSAKRVRHGDTVRLVDVEKRRTTKRTRVRPGVVEVPTTKLAPGRRKVVRDGRAGVQRVEVVRTLHNGEPERYRVASRTWVRKPQPRRVLVGRQPFSVDGADGLNWGALAGCESGGNPRAVNPAGYYGLYQFNVATWRSVGGSGMPHHASPGEQTYRAKLLYKSRGRSPWPHCGRLL
ncbi:transglycosylase family protein [Nocardioides sp. zg-1308]|uniref:resuscitation-promoting factor n=1 Tax=Nocardioides sp. zg-1308 TaxID=2736253 RepID=UPI003463ED66